MLDFLTGEASVTDDGLLALDCGAMGFTLACSGRCLDRLLPGDGRKRVYTHLAFSESGFSLYGFFDPEERAMFRSLLGVPKVGPKAAMGILTVFEPREAAYIISSGDVRSLSKAAGVGRKLAESIVFTLKGKFAPGDISFTEEAYPQAGDAKSEALLALTSLGFERSDAVRAVSAVFSEGMDAREMIALALARIGG